MKTQMKAKTLTVLAGMVSLFTHHPAYACMPLPSGWYIEGSGGSVRQQDASNGGLTTDTSGLGWNATIGYKFMPFLAIEAGYTQYGIIKEKNGATTVMRNRPVSVDFAAKGIIPIANSGFEPFGKVGYARSKNKIQVTDAALIPPTASTDNESASGLYLGAGAQYYFMPELAVVAEWNRAAGNNDSVGHLDLYSIGLSFIFDMI